MKILFKNNTKYTKEKYNDFIEFHKNKYGKKMIIKFVITVICVLYILIFNIINKNWLVILLLTGIAIMFYLLNNVKNNKIQKQNKKMLRDRNQFTFFFYEHFIKIKCGRKFDRIRYFELYKIFETKEYFFLYVDETHSLIVSKEGFEIGTAREFSDFIRKKCLLKYNREKEHKQ